MWLSGIVVVFMLSAIGVTVATSHQREQGEAELASAESKIRSRGLPMTPEERKRYRIGKAPTRLLSTAAGPGAGRVERLRWSPTRRKGEVAFSGQLRCLRPQEGFFTVSLYARPSQASVKSRERCGHRFRLSLPAHFNDRLTLSLRDPQPRPALASYELHWGGEQDGWLRLTR